MDAQQLECARQMGKAIVDTAAEIDDLQKQLGYLSGEENPRLNEECPLTLVRKIRGEWSACESIRPLGKYVIEALKVYVAIRIERLSCDLRTMMAPSEKIVARMSGTDNDAAGDGSDRAENDDADRSSGQSTPSPREITIELNTRWIEQAADRQHAEN